MVRRAHLVEADAVGAMADWPRPMRRYALGLAMSATLFCAVSSVRLAVSVGVLVRGWSRASARSALVTIRVVG